MKPTTDQTLSALAETESTINRRRAPRVAKRLSLTMSYVEEGNFVMDDVDLTDLSAEGMGLRARRPLKSGMDVALFIAQPAEDDDWCIPAARISWANGRHFGLALHRLSADDRHKLQSLCRRRTKRSRLTI